MYRQLTLVEIKENRIQSLFYILWVEILEKSVKLFGNYTRYNFVKLSQVLHKKLLLITIRIASSIFMVTIQSRTDLYSC